jgi:carbon-monoxide dehydrogenase large subunit
MLLGRPVKWIEDRMENFIATAAERNQVWEAEAAFDADGRLLGIRGRLFHDHGAYTPYGVALPYNACTNLIGPYVLPAYHMDIMSCLTNMLPGTPTRGAGRPQGTFVMERLLDRAAAAFGIARDEIRRRNLIPPERMPYPTPVLQRDGGAMTYDSGDYPKCQRRALAAAGWTDFPSRREAARREGRFIGIGVGNYVEGTGRGPFESAAIRIGASGKIVVTTGATAQGQGVKTMLAQLAADVLDVNPADIHVVDGDTAASPLGLGAYASRQAVTAGNAVYRAAQIVADKIKMTAAALLEASADDMELVGGAVRVKGVPGMKRSIAEIAHALSGVPGFALPGGLPPGLAAAVDFEPPSMTYTNGTHVVEAEVDPVTGAVRLNRYVVVHDCGRIINPMMLDGQVLGGVVNGIGTTLFEWMRHAEDGQPLTVNYADYLLPTADAIPPIEIHHMESPTPTNPLGVKGAAESGTIGAPAAIVSAIEDALAPLDIVIRDLPVTPARLRALIAAAEAKARHDAK